MFRQIAILVFIVKLISANDPVCTQGAQPGVNPSACCRIPQFLDQGLVDKCTAQIKNQQPAVPDNLSGTCTTECIFNETGMLKDKEFQPDAAKAYITEMMKGDEEWAKIATAALDKCQESAMKIKDKLIKPNEANCLPISSFYYGCVGTQLFKNCPPSKWTESGGCSELKQNAEKCNVLMAVVQSEK